MIGFFIPPLFFLNFESALRLDLGVPSFSSYSLEISLVLRLSLKLLLSEMVDILLLV